MPDPDLAPDCSRCDALCCILLAFDASEAFAEDKPACAACRHLNRDNSCAVHSDLADQGYAGCASYTCYGAGQRITQTLFKGRSWRRDATVLPAMEEAFRTLRSLHEAAWLMQEAARLPLPPETEARRLALVADLRLAEDWSEDSLRAPALATALRAVRQFLASLRDVPEVRQRRR